MEMAGIKGTALVVALVIAVLRSTSAQETTPVACSTECEPGCALNQFSKDPETGCPTCSCGRTCEDVTCADNQECVLQEVQCFVPPCFPQPECVEKKECRMLKCRPDCSPGKDSSGCPTCECPPSSPTCEDVVCERDQVCEMQQVACFVAPCPPQPTCVTRCPEQPPCGIRCRYGLATDDRGCQLCECLPAPCPELTDCLTIKCAYGQETDANGCALCQCRASPER